MVGRQFVVVFLFMATRTKRVDGRTRARTSISTHSIRSPHHPTTSSEIELGDPG